MISIEVPDTIFPLIKQIPILGVRVVPRGGKMLITCNGQSREIFVKDYDDFHLRHLGKFQTTAKLAYPLASPGDTFTVLCIE